MQQLVTAFGPKNDIRRLPALFNKWTTAIEEGEAVFEDVGGLYPYAIALLRER
jgi:hypothetical protein